jgi:hypothetical protein
MTYIKTTWTDRQIQYPGRFTRTSDGTYDTLAPAPGTITQAGTPLTAAALNKLETQYDQAVTDIGIITSGSNANGSYIKFPDGTMIQWMYVTYIANEIPWSTTTQAGTTYYYTATNWTFPVSFIDLFKISVHASGDIPTFGIEQHKAYNPSIISCRVEQGVLGIDPATIGAVSCYKSLLAVGRWK